MLMTKQKLETTTKVNLTARMVFLIQVCLRLLGLVFSIVATCVTFTCHQTADVFGVPMVAKYSYQSAFKFYAITTAVTSGFSLVTLCAVVILRSKGLLKQRLLCFFFCHDLMIMLLLLAACAAATAIGFVGKYGNDHAGWVPICDNFHTFCHRATIAVLFGYLGVVSYLTLTVIYVVNTYNQVAAAYD